MIGFLAAGADAEGDVEEDVDVEEDDAQALGKLFC